VSVGGGAVGHAAPFTGRGAARVRGVAGQTPPYVGLLKHQKNPDLVFCRLASVRGCDRHARRREQVLLTSPNPRAPLVFDVSEFAHRPGSMRRMNLSVAAPAELGIVVVGVPAGSAIELQLRLEAVVEGVLVSGTAWARFVGECARCLDPIEGDVEVEIQELYAFEAERTDEEELALEADLLDLEPALRDAVVLALPLAPLCREDCPGLCPQCGARLADSPGHVHQTTDLRWAALAGFAPRDEDGDETYHTDSAGKSGRTKES
jgi:uncharacterized protein